MESLLLSIPCRSLDDVFVSRLVFGSRCSKWDSRSMVTSMVSNSTTPKGDHCLSLRERDGFSPNIGEHDARDTAGTISHRATE